MRWEEELEIMESQVEKSEGEKNTEATPITDIYDLKEEILKAIDTLATIKQLQELGEDVQESLNIIEERIKELVNLGREKFGLSEEDAEIFLDNIPQEKTNSGISK